MTVRSILHTLDKEELVLLLSIWTWTFTCKLYGRLGNIFESPWLNVFENKSDRYLNREVDQQIFSTSFFYSSAIAPCHSFSLSLHFHNDLVKELQIWQMQFQYYLETQTERGKPKPFLILFWELKLRIRGVFPWPGRRRERRDNASCSVTHESKISLIRCSSPPTYRE